MAKREFAHPNEMHKYVGQEIGVSDWVEVTQQKIDQFAEATGDHQWIHVDVERAKKDMNSSMRTARSTRSPLQTSKRPICSCPSAISGCWANMPAASKGGAAKTCPPHS